MEWNDTLVSVIIPTYKRPPHMLKRALASVLSQTHQRLEVIVVDDSPDSFEGRDLIRRMIEDLSDNRVTYIRHQENQGACAARNTGINSSKGAFIAFLDDDDEWLPEKLALQLPEMENPMVGLVYCGSESINQLHDRRSIHMPIHPNSHDTDGLLGDLLSRNFIGSTSFVLIRRACFEACGLFDTQMQVSQDMELYLRIIGQYDVACVDKVLARYYVHDGERISADHAKRVAAIQTINCMYADYLLKHKRVHSKRLHHLAHFYGLAGQRRKALKTWLTATTLAPRRIKANFISLALIIKYL